MKEKKYYIYMLRCTDNSIYTGITSDIDRRMHEHFSKSEKCAKYTKTHSAKQVELVFMTNNRVDACKLEYWIKTLSKSDKEGLILNKKIINYLPNIDYKLYKVYKKCTKTYN